MSDLLKVKRSSDVPRGHHFAIIVYNRDSVYIEGDERSRTNPGHGYPGGTQYFDTFEHYVTTDRKQWEQKIASLMPAHNHLTRYDPKDFIAFEVAGVAEVKQMVTVTTTIK